jgi:hypothetical protein
MQHRHLEQPGFSLAAIDDVIARGRRADWAELRVALLANPDLAEKIRKVCLPRLPDPYAQRYHFRNAYFQQRFPS